jgi:choline dehydrogenase
MPETQSYDYIIVGAGSAGCVLASRLTEDADVRVLLLEAGGRDSSIFIHMPAALAKPLANDKYNWFYHSEPEPHLNGRRMYCPRGRVIGGSSSINGMAYVRGHARDYDRWAQGGLQGWDYSHVLPYFRKAETYERGADAYRGGDGPLNVSAGACRNPLFKAWVEAGRQAGYPVTQDMNGFQQEGFAHMDMTVHKGRRWSAAVAYLKPAMTRPNLTVWTRALTTRVLFENGRAVGVELAKDRERIAVRAEREVILSGGAINSPQVLLLSGVGPGRRDPQHGIEVVHDLPGVGKNLQDHLELYLQHACTQPITLYSIMKALEPGADRHLAGSSSRPASAPPATSRPAASSAAAPGSSIPTCSTTSCRRHELRRQPPRPAATASRPTSAPCAPRAAARCPEVGRPARHRRASSSTTCRRRQTARSSAPACA